MQYNINDRIITKKSHPCGGKEWEIIRTGADFKLKCLTCGHIIMLDFEQLKKRTKKHIPFQE